MSQEGELHFVCQGCRAFGKLPEGVRARRVLCNSCGGVIDLGRVELKRMIQRAAKARLKSA